MTVVDTSAIVDFLLADGIATEVSDLFTAEIELAAPDVLVFETLAALRRGVLRGALAAARAEAAVSDLGQLSLELHSAMGLRRRAWMLRENITAADALFVALAERLGERLATKDRGLAEAASRHAGIEVLALG